MKKIILVLSVAIILVSCRKESSVDYVILSGKIENKTSDYIILSNNSNTINATIAVSATGEFIDTLKIVPGNYRITDGKIYTSAYLEPPLNLNISFDTKNFDNSLFYSGEGAPTNTYLQIKNRKEREIMGNYQSFYNLDETEFKAKANEIKTSLLGLLSEHHDIDDEFVKKETRNIDYQYISKLITYKNHRSNSKNNPEDEVSDDFLTDMADFDYNNTEDFQYSVSYKSFVKTYFRNLSQNLVKSENLDTDIAYLTAISTSPNETIKNELLFEDAQSGISYTYNLDNYYDVFINNSTNKKNNETISESYHTLQTVAVGKPSPTFSDYENNDGSKTSLKDFIGKYVYIDVWATWCAPCKKEVPYLKELGKTYNDKDIVFISISVDDISDHDKWKKTVADESLFGVQLFAANSWDSQFIKDYLIMAIPHFILLDPQGSIINANAPRPSQTSQLIDLFEKFDM